MKKIYAIIYKKYPNSIVGRYYTHLGHVKLKLTNLPNMSKNHSDYEIVEYNLEEVDRMKCPKDISKLKELFNKMKCLNKIEGKNNEERR